VVHGLEKLFELANGSNLLDSFADGSLTSMADLVAQLQALVALGSGSVTWNGDETTPLVNLDLTRQLDGTAAIDIEFDRFGGHAEIEGEATIHAAVRLRLTFGIDSGGEFFVRTDGADPELSFSNIAVDGTFEGEGRLGFLGIELDNAHLVVNGVTVAVNLVTTGGTLSVYDLEPTQLEDFANVEVTGPASGNAVTVTADIRASAFLPGQNESEPLDIVTATSPSI